MTGSWMIAAGRSVSAVLCAVVAVMMVVSPVGATGVGGGAGTLNPDHALVAGGWGHQQVPKAGRVEFMKPTWDNKTHKWKPLKPWKCGKKGASFLVGGVIAWVGRVKNTTSTDQLRVHLVKLRKHKVPRLLYNRRAAKPHGAVVRGLLGPNAQGHFDMYGGSSYRVSYWRGSRVVASGQFKVQRYSGTIIYGY